MADRRMFSKTIVLSDAFLDMPCSARCLYFTFSMLADDDGFVGSPKAIMRQCGASADDLKVLLSKRYVLGFESGVIVVKHWRLNNYIQKDRYKHTTYIEEYESLCLDSKGSYTEKEKNPSCIQNGYGLETQNRVRLGKDSIGEYIEGETSSPTTKTNRFTPPSVDDVRTYCEERSNNIDAEQFIDYYESKGWMIGKNKMRDWKAAVRTWERNGVNCTKAKANDAGVGAYDADEFFEAALRRSEND